MWLRRFTSNRKTFSRSGCAGAAVLLTSLSALPCARAQATDGTYGRLDGDLLAGAEIGISEAIGDEASRGESMALRLTMLYLSTAGVFGQYNETFGADAQPVARAASYGVELRPLFLGRWAQDMEHGPAYLDLWLDSISLTLGMHHLWRGERHCNDPAMLPPRPTAACNDFGMEFSLGMELPLLPQANTPFIALRGAVRWSLSSFGPDDLGGRRPQDPAIGLITLTLGYHHLFATHLVDMGDAPPPD